MKAALYKPYCRPSIRVPYPNAATRRQIFHKLLDTSLVAASGMGIAATLLLMMVFR